MCTTFLIQAFQQLDQKQQVQVLPLVCKLTRQLAFRSISAISITLKTEASVRCMAAWIQNQKPPALRSLSIVVVTDLGPPLDVASTMHFQSPSQLLLEAATQHLPLLNKLHLRERGRPYTVVGYDYSLENSMSELQLLFPISARALITLSLTDCVIVPETAFLLLHLTQLRSLHLKGCEIGEVPGHQGSFLGALSSKLLQLTSLTCSNKFRSKEFALRQLAALSNLTTLQRVAVEDLQVRPEDLQELQNVPLSHVSIGFSAFVPRLLGHDVGRVCGWLGSAGRCLQKLELVRLGQPRLPCNTAYTQQLLSAVGLYATKLQALTLRSVRLPEGTGVAALAPLAGLTSLTLDACHGLTGEAVSNFWALTALKALTLLPLCPDEEAGNGTAAIFEMQSLQGMAGLPHLEYVRVRPACRPQDLAAVRQVFGDRIQHEVHDSMPVCDGFSYSVYQESVLTFRQRAT
jgi:hypothetical protein